MQTDIRYMASVDSKEYTVLSLGCKQCKDADIAQLQPCHTHA